MKNIIQLTNENKKLKAELETFKKTYASALAHITGTLEVTVRFT